MFEIIRYVRVAMLCLGAVALACFGVWSGYTWVFGSGTLHIVPPLGFPVEVSIDGGPKKRVDGGAHSTFVLPRGSHKVSVTGQDVATAKDSTIVYDVKPRSGFDNEVISSDVSQCFVLFDVGDAMYGSPGSHPPPPKIEKRMNKSAEPFSIPSSTYFSDTELPTSVEEGSAVHLLLDLDCEQIGVPDEELLRVMGFKKN